MQLLSLLTEFSFLNGFLKEIIDILGQSRKNITVSEPAYWRLLWNWCTICILRTKAKPYVYVFVRNGNCRGFCHFASTKQFYHNSAVHHSLLIWNLLLEIKAWIHFPFYPSCLHCKECIAQLPKKQINWCIWRYWVLHKCLMCNSCLLCLEQRRWLPTLFDVVWEYK